MSLSLVKHVVSKEKTIDLIVGICGVFISWVAWFVPSSTTVPLYIFLITLIVLILLLSKLYLYADACKSEIDDLRNKLASQNDGYIPKIIRISESPSGDLVFLSTRTPFYRHGMTVAIVYDNDGVEEVIANGVVINIQSNDLMQSRLIEVASGYDGTFNEILKNQSIYRAKIKILPGA